MTTEKKSEREEQRQSLVAEAQRLPGIPELMDLYGHWKQADQYAAFHRSVQATNAFTTSDHTNPDPER